MKILAGVSCSFAERYPGQGATQVHHMVATSLQLSILCQIIITNVNCLNARESKDGRCIIEPQEILPEVTYIITI